MLSFTYEDKQSKHQNYIEQPQFQPIIISNTTGKNKPMANPKVPQKKIVKTNSYSVNKVILKPKKEKKVSQNKAWDSHSYNQALFDKRLKKDSLAAEQRRIRSAAKKRAEQNYVGNSREYRIVQNQDHIHHQKFTLISNQKDKQIQQLRRVIQKQRAQKERNDQIYEIKKRQIQQQRKQLIKLEKQIQRDGPKAKKQVRQKLRNLSPQNYPGNDRAKCHQDIQQIPNTQKSKFNEITQSQSIINQKNQLRQYQLKQLMNQRQRNNLQYQRNTLGYTPTLIPLLSRASYKIISTHISSLVELFIDDLLEEQVYLLQAIQLQTKAEQERNKQKQILHDYINNLNTFVDEIEQVEDKIGKYSQMRFQDIYIHRNKPISSYSHSFEYKPNLHTFLELDFTRDQMEEILSRTDRFKRFVSNFREYRPEQMKAFKDSTEQIIDDIILKLAKQFDKGSGEFVDIVFRNEFD